MTDELRATPSANCDSLTLLQGIDTFVHYTAHCLQSGRRDITIFSPTLPRPLFAHERVCAALSALVRSHRSAEARILVTDPEPLLSGHHALVQLQQRLPSKIKIRQTSPPPQQPQRCYLICDRRQLLLQHEEGQFDGFCNTEAAVEVRGLLEEFNELWERHSREIPGLRTFTNL